MKRTLKYALSAVLTAAIVAPALAQDNFPDTPANHWAFEALARLKKDGILVGYPDGLYRGGRPASRYELAAAVHAAYVNLKNQSDGLASQIQALTDKVNNNQVTKADLDNLKAALASAQNDINSMKGWGDDIANLKKMADTFQKELQSMGVDVEGLKKSLGDLADRVLALEKRKPAVDISGDVNLLMLAGSSDGGRFGITVDGRPTGFGRGDTDGHAVGMTRDLSIMHEAGLTLTSTNDSGPKWHGTVVIGNMLDNFAQGSDGMAFPNQSTLGVGSSFGEGNEDIYLQDLAILWNTSIMNWNFNVEAGRIGVKVSPLIFQRPDVTPYYVNDRWDNGKYYFDGANIGLGFGMAKVHVFAGRDNPSEGGQVGNFTAQQPLFAGANGFPTGVNGFTSFTQTGGGSFSMAIAQHLGATVDFPIGTAGNVNLAYLWLNSNGSQNGGSGAGSKVNGVNVYGGSIYWNFGGFGVDGAYSKSNLVFNNHNVTTSQNDAWWVNIGRDWNRWGAKVGYREINPQFGAPGDWGRIGIWWNPTDIKGWTADAHFDINDSLRLVANGQFYTSTGNSVNGVTNPLNTSDKVQSIVLGLQHRMGTANTVDLGYEDVRWTLPDANGTVISNPTGDKPFERWWNLGFSHKINDNSFFRVLWQMSDFDAKSQGFLNPFGLPSGSTAAANQHKGSLLTTQLSVKF